MIDKAYTIFLLLVKWIHLIAQLYLDSAYNVKAYPLKKCIKYHLIYQLFRQKEIFDSSHYHR